MTTTSSTSGSSAINNISSQYTARKTDEDPMGKDAFMTMLIAQLKHQDPLNPMDGTDFTAQLAQFTQLEKKHEHGFYTDKNPGILEWH